jgi:hypothetical protein
VVSALAALVASALPAAAVASGGGGTVDGGVVFTTGSIPPIFQGCNPVVWQFNSNRTPVANPGGNQPIYTSNGAVVAINDSTFAGSLTIGASGTSAGCETTQGGQGSLTVSYTFGQNLTTVGQFSCDPLNGAYVRKGSIVELQVQGQCYITGSPAQMVAVTAAVLTPPQGSVGSVPGVNTSISSATVDGAWVEVTT